MALPGKNSYRKGHQYLTEVTDLESSTVEFVEEGRAQKTLDGCYASLPNEHLESILAVGMDMWKPFLNATRKHVPDADAKICFGKFHVPSIGGMRSTRGAGRSRKIFS